MSLSASLDCFYGRRWQSFKGSGLPMQALKYFSLQGSLFTRPDNRALAADLLLTFWHKSRYLKYHQPYTAYRCQPRVPTIYHSLAPSLWYFIPAVIYRKHHESFISWAIRACKLICRLDIIFEKDQETCFLSCNSAWFWDICYSNKVFHLVHSFRAWIHYYDPISEALMHIIGSAKKRSSTLEAWRIVFCGSWFSPGIKIFLIENVRMIFAIELKEGIASVSIFGVIVGKFSD